MFLKDVLVKHGPLLNTTVDVLERYYTMVGTENDHQQLLLFKPPYANKKTDLERNHLIDGILHIYF